METGLYQKDCGTVEFCVHEQGHCGVGRSSQDQRNDQRSQSQQWSLHPVAGATSKQTQQVQQTTDQYQVLQKLD